MPRATKFLTILLTLAIPLSAGADCMGPYPPSMVKAFNQNCAQDPKMTSFCSCLMDDVQKNIPLADFIEIGNSQGGINNDPRFIKASKQCATLLTPAPVPTQVPAASIPAVQQAPSGSLPPANFGRSR